MRMKNRFHIKGLVHNLVTEARENSEMAYSRGNGFEMGRLNQLNSTNSN